MGGPSPETPPRLPSTLTVPLRVRKPVGKVAQVRHRPGSATKDDLGPIPWVPMRVLADHPEVPNRQMFLGPTLVATLAADLFGRALAGVIVHDSAPVAQA